MYLIILLITYFFIDSASAGIFKRGLCGPTCADDLYVVQEVPAYYFINRVKPCIVCALVGGVSGGGGYGPPTGGVQVQPQQPSGGSYGPPTGGAQEPPPQPPPQPPPSGGNYGPPTGGAQEPPPQPPPSGGSYGPPGGQAGGFAASDSSSGQAGQTSSG